MQKSGNIWLDWFRFFALALGIWKEPENPKFDNSLKPSFKAYYRQHIFPLLPRYESLRRAALRSFRIRLFWFSLAQVLLSLLWPLRFIGRWLSGNLTRPQPSTNASWNLWKCFSRIEKYKARIREDIYPLIVRSVGEEWTYEAEGGVSVNIFQPFLPLPEHTIGRTYDYLGGEYKGVKIEFVAAELFCEKRDGPKLAFKGFFLYCRLTRPIKGEVVIKPHRSLAGLWGNKPPEGMKEIHLEDVIFSRRFDVWGTDQIDARRILTPSLMQRLLRLTDVMTNRQISVSYKNQGVLFMIPSEYNHLVDPSFADRATFMRECNLILAAINDICRIVEVMRLYRRVSL